MISLKRYILFIFTVASISQLPLISQEIYASGRVRYFDHETQTWKPVANAEIRFYNPGGWLTYTDANGYYSHSLGTTLPDYVTVYLFFRNQYIDLQEAVTTRSDSRRADKEINPPPFYLPGDEYAHIDFDFTDNWANYALIFDHANKAANFSVAQGFTPEQCLVKYPLQASIVDGQWISASGSFFWPFATTTIDNLFSEWWDPFVITLELLGFNPQLTANTIYINDLVKYDPSTVYHEYGHFIMKQKRGDWPVSLGEYTSLQVPFNHNPDDVQQNARQSYIEGWSNYYEMAVSGWVANPQSPYSVVKLLVNGENYKPIIGPDGYKHEYTVANAFWDLYDPANDELFQTSYANISNVMGEKQNLMSEFISTLAHKSYITDAQRNAGIGLMNLGSNKMNPLTSYGNATMYVKNDFNGGIVNINNSDVNTSSLGGAFSATELWMSTYRTLLAKEQMYDNYQRLFKHVRPNNQTETWTTGNNDKKNFTETWGVFTDALTFTANFDRACNITFVKYGLDEGAIIENNTTAYRSETPVSLSAQDITYGGIAYKFMDWENGSTSNPRVVTATQHQQFTANYKGHLLTNSINAIASNSQRKIIQDENYDNLHLVYESGGNIYSTYSDDNGETWSPELRVNSTLGGCFSPSITYSQSRYQVIAAWLQDIGGARYAVIAFCYGSGDPWIQIQSIAAPNAQQLQISSMTNGGSSDLLVWREGTSQLKGTLRISSTSTFGTVYNLLYRDYNYISGFSLGAFGRSDRWDLVWVENGNLYYSSIYDYESLSLPKLDYYTNPSVVASASDWIHYNPSIVKTGNNLTVAWESYYEEIVKRNIKVVQITPNLPSYPTIGTATTFTNLGSTSYYYTPSISSHSNNDLSLSWRNGASTILCAKRVNGSWQSVTTLGSGIDPSASERFDNTQNSSIHFRRGTSLPYILANTTITTSTGRELDKSGSDGGSLFAGEGRELFLRSAKGTSSFALINASTGVIPIVFEEVDDSRNISAINDIRIALRSKPFISTGELSVELAYHSYGELPPLRKVRVLLEEVSEKGVSIHPLGIAGEFEGSKRSNETVSFTIPKTERPIRILIDPVVRDDSMHIEVSKWYTVDASNASMEKSGKESQQRRIVVPAVLDLLQNYPNPFNPVTTIEFTVPKDGNAKLTVYNSLGQVVATLYDGFVQSGYVQKATFDGTQLSSGVYYSRLEYDGKSIMKKLMLLK